MNKVLNHNNNNILKKVNTALKYLLNSNVYSFKKYIRV